jgi:hypothetical protein
MSLTILTWNVRGIMSSPLPECVGLLNFADTREKLYLPKKLLQTSSFHILHLLSLEIVEFQIALTSCLSLINKI